MIIFVKTRIYPGYMEMKRLYTSSMTLLCLFSCFAYNPKVRNYYKFAYNASTQNWAVAQNSSGTMYFANNNGILEFDGRNWTCYPLNNGTNAHCVAAFGDRIYVGGANEVGCLCTGASDRLEYVSLLDSLNLYASEIWNICRYNGALVFHDNNSLFIVRDGKTETYTFKERINALISFNGHLVTAVSGKGVLYYTAGGFVPMPHTGIMKGKTICRILPFRNNGLLFVTEKDGIWKYDYSKTELLEKYSGLVSDKVFCAAYKDDILAIGTISDGVFIKDYGRGVTMHMNSDTGLQNNTVLDLFFDSDSNLWAGLNNGIDHIILSSAERPLFSRPEIHGTGYACQMFGGRLYLGTNQGLFVEEDGGYRKVSGLEGQVWNLQRVGEELFCCHDRGVFVLDGNERLYHIPSDGAWKIERLTHHPGVLLCSSYSRLFTIEYQNGSWRYGHQIKGFDLPSKAFVEDALTGDIWFSHYIKGLFRLKLSEKADSVTSVRYFAEPDGFPTGHNNIPNKVDGRILFSTEGGFYRMDPATDTAVPETELNRKFKGAPKIATMYKTKDGTVYYSSGVLQALEYVDAAGGTVMDSLSMKSLVGRRPVGFDCIEFTAPGTFIVNTEDGFSQINIDDLRKSRPAQGKVYIRSIDASGREKTETVWSSRQNGARRSALRLPWSQNTLSIDFICPGYVYDREYEYSYMLENYDENYSPFSYATSKGYTKLPSGKYVFHVTARSSYGRGLSSDSVEIIIENPWFRTPYAYAGYALALLLFASGIVFAARRIYAAKMAEIEKKKREELHKKELELELAHKAQDIANSTMNVIRKNEILMDIDGNLQKAVDHIGDDRNKTIRIINNIRRHIQENIGHDDDWQKFRTNFDLTYSDYLKRLSDRYPALTAGDLKLCAYLKMGLRSKDMAPLLNMTVRSVEMTRYRLRTKLSLDRDTNLSDFLQRF